MDYKKLYHIMFNAATDAIDYINEKKYDMARLVLVLAQMKAEQEYINMAEDEE